jgi:signal transduction histidine kinase
MPTRVNVQRARTDTYRSWLIGELVLATVLASATAVFVAASGLAGYHPPKATLAVDTTVAVVACIVAVLSLVKFRVEGRLLDLVLAAGLAVVGLGTLAFAVAPDVRTEAVTQRDAWATVAAEIGAAALIAASPFLARRSLRRRLALAAAVGGVATLLLGAWLLGRLAPVPLTLPGPGEARAAAPTLAFSVLALLSLTAAVGYGLRFRRFGRDLDRWLALALTLILFADLHYVLVAKSLLYDDFLRLLAYGVLLVGVWRAYSIAEFGRAVADERARVARDIHDGLAQYLFALSTHVSMLESGAPLEELLPRLKEASTAAQQEARFAVLALSSASGTAPFDAALRRYVEFLTVGGELEVELEIDPEVRLAPDEQIEVFRIVQEGLANVRRHAQARRAEVTIANRGARRIVVVRDDGTGFEGAGDAAGQGLRNMRLRAEAIEGGFSLRSQPGSGTAIEVVLRPA